MKCTEYRICEVCNKCQIFYYDSQGDSYNILSKQETKILLDFTELKDDFYLLTISTKESGNE